MTLHTLIDEVTKELNLTPEQQFQLTAKIKRYVHNEKLGLCQRLFRYSNFRRIGKGRRQKNKVKLSGLRFMQSFLQDKIDTHKQYIAATDEEIVTWDIGSHRYVQKKEMSDEAK